jgi:23S rRNA pseudouridine1911/1915/1917 synthase
VQTILLRASSHDRWELPVLHEDDVLLAIAKPSGFLTSPDRYDKQRPNLMSLLHRGIREQSAWARERGLSYLANVHRLDADTSGVLLLAKSKEALNALAGQFVQRQTKKAYLALVQGVPSPAEQNIEKRIAPHPTREGLFVARNREGKEALTRIRVQESLGRYALVQAEPVTGRTHQIRVHLKSIGHSIVGDSLYGTPGGIFLSDIKRGYKRSKAHEERPLLGRLALHAERLTIQHPATRQPLEIVAPLPHDFAVALRYLRKFCG